MFEIIKYFYKNGQYSKKDVEIFLNSHMITEEEFNEITAEKLTEEFNEITAEKLTEEEINIMNSVEDDSEEHL